MKKFEYKEPEFKVVKATCEDILTMSNNGNLSSASQPWVTATTGGDGGMAPIFS